MVKMTMMMKMMRIKNDDNNYGDESNNDNDDGNDYGVDHGNNDDD